MSQYEIHKQQYEYCRKVCRGIEDNLKPNECIVYRDFVNQHNWTGGKVWNLVMTMLWREPLPTGGSTLRVRKIHNVCTDKDTGGATAWFMADVWRFHMGKKSKNNPGYFDKFDRICICGDHGPHFSCPKTFYHESKTILDFRKILTCHFLCAYHGFNRCNGAGCQMEN